MQLKCVNYFRTGQVWIPGSGGWEAGKKGNRKQERGKSIRGLKSEVIGRCKKEAGKMGGQEAGMLLSEVENRM
jgi:hypothetical protein